MTRPADFLKKNALTCCMLFFTVFFYFFFWVVSRSAPKDEGLAAVQRTETLSRQQLAGKEDVFRKNLMSRPRLLGFVSLLFFSVFILGLILDVRLIIRRMLGHSWLEGTAPPASARWGLSDVFQVFVFMLFAEAAITIFEMLGALFINLRHLEHDLFLMGNSFVRDLLVAGFVIYLVRKKFGQPLSDIGLTGRAFLRNLRTGVLGYVSMIPVLIFSLMLLALIARSLSYEPPPQDVVRIYLGKSAEKHLLFFTFFVAVLGPAIEEIFFRGFAYKAFRERLGVPGAMVVTSAVFAFFHMNLMALLPVFLLGIFLSYLYERTGSLVPSMAAHMVHNLIMVALTLGFKALSG